MSTDSQSICQRTVGRHIGRLPVDISTESVDWQRPLLHMIQGLFSGFCFWLSVFHFRNDNFHPHCTSLHVQKPVWVIYHSIPLHAIMGLIKDYNNCQNLSIWCVINNNNICKSSPFNLCYCCQYQILLKRSSLKNDTKDEVEATVAILEKLPKPKPPNVKGHFYSNWKNILSS